MDCKELVCCFDESQAECQYATLDQEGRQYWSHALLQVLDRLQFANSISALLTGYHFLPPKACESVKQVLCIMWVECAA